MADTLEQVLADKQRRVSWCEMREAIDAAERAVAVAASLAARRGDSDAVDQIRAIGRRVRRVAKVGFGGSQVYVVRRGTARLVKIGVTSNLERRIAALRTGAGAALELLVAFPGERGDEQRIHHRFAAYRLHGEWFEYAPSLQRWVTRVQRGERPNA